MAEKSRTDDAGVARRINLICTGADGLNRLHPRDAWIIACGVVAVTAIALGKSAEETFTGVAAALNVALEDAPR